MGGYLALRRLRLRRRVMLCHPIRRRYDGMRSVPHSYNGGALSLHTAKVLLVNEVVGRDRAREWASAHSARSRQWPRSSQGKVPVAL